MKKVGVFEAKTKLSEICEEVARTRLPVLITRRGMALVWIDPLEKEPSLTLKERRAAYMAKHGANEGIDHVDFEPAARSREQASFRIEE